MKWPFQSLLNFCLQSGDASGTTYYNVHTKKWDPAAMALIDDRLHNWVPELIGSNEVRIRKMAEYSSGMMEMDCKKKRKKIIHICIYIDNNNIICIDNNNIKMWNARSRTCLLS